LPLPLNGADATASIGLTVGAVFLKIREAVAAANAAMMEGHREHLAGCDRVVAAGVLAAEHKR